MDEKVEAWQNLCFKEVREWNVYRSGVEPTQGRWVAKYEFISGTQVVSLVMI